MQQSDGKLVAAGSTVSLDTSSYDFALVRYNTDGSLDTTFGTGGEVTTDFAGTYDIATALVQQSDGKLVAAGRATGDFALARYIERPRPPRPRRSPLLASRPPGRGG